MEQTQAIRPDDDRALRPKSLANFLGQEAVKQNLAICTASALARSESLDHVLLSGPPGLGKTTLAEILAIEMNARLVVLNAPSIKSKGELVSVLVNLGRGDILFIDEIHALHPKIAEILYPALEDFKLEIVAANQAVKIKLEPFTMIGATTSAGKLPRPLRDRFGIICEMQPYSEDELTQIIFGSAAKLGLVLEETGARELARRSRGTPRIANRLLRRVRDYSHSLSRSADDQVVKLTCDNLGIDSAGLDATSQKYLFTLVERSTPVALNTLVSLLGEAKDVVEDMIEPYLMSIGFVEKTPKGRVATSAGRQHLRLEH